jgi:thymidine kinase
MENKKKKTWYDIYLEEIEREKHQPKKESKYNTVSEILNTSKPKTEFKLFEGSMFAGKSLELVKIAQKSKGYLAFKPDGYDRDNGCIKSRGSDMVVKCFFVKETHDIYKNLKEALNYKKIHDLIIDEGQFFHKNLAFTLSEIRLDFPKVNIYIGALDKFSSTKECETTKILKETFPELEVIKKTAICHCCKKDGATETIKIQGDPRLDVQPEWMGGVYAPSHNKEYQEKHDDCFAIPMKEVPYLEKPLLNHKGKELLTQHSDSKHYWAKTILDKRLTKFTDDKIELV